MSALYTPYKAVGFVTDGNPFVISSLGNETFLISSINKSFQVYRTDKLTVCMASTLANATIDHLYAIGHETFAAIGSSIVVYNRGRVVRQYDIEGCISISGLCGVGVYLLVFDNTNNITIINTKERKIMSKVLMISSARISSIIHPATYINKFLIGYSNGQLDLWNSNKQTIIYSFKSHIHYLQQLSRSSLNGPVTTPGITAMEQSPACDVIGIGFESGDILLMNIKQDKVLFAFKQECPGGVTSLSFRTDAESTQFPYMASASSDGRIFMWNLGIKRATVGDDGDDNDEYNADANAKDATDEENESSPEPKFYFERKLQFVMDEAHMQRINKIQFLHGEPILVSSSVDNSIKMWIFDSPDGRARLLRSRSGHATPSTRIRYYGGITNASAGDNADATSCEILSIGSDATLRLFNTALESHNMELSQNVALRKQRLTRRNQRLPTCLDFDISEARERNWGNLVTIHKNQSHAYVWKYKHRTITEMVLKQPQWNSNELTTRDVDARNNHSTAVCLSACGNFCAIGSRGGTIYLYNLQSGLTRGSFPSDRASAILSSKVVKIRENVAGNVLQLQKSIAEEGKGGEVNSLKRKLPADKEPRKDTNTGLASIPESSISDIRCHSQDVTGIFIDITNTIMCSCSLDGNIIFWNYLTHEIISILHFECAHLRLVGSRDAGFVAIIGNDRIIRLFDVSVQRLIRRFSNGHSREVTDMVFTPDGRRLVSCSLDTTVRVWDIPTGRCLSWMSFESPILSVAMSHSGEYLCLVQAGKVGIFMCIDKSLYETVHIWKEPVAPVHVADSTIHVDKGDSADEPSELLHISPAVNAAAEQDPAGDANSHLVTVSSSQGQVITNPSINDVVQHGAGTVTMTKVPRAYWTTLFNLEQIKERNKPIAPPEAPKAAPFFLPTVFRGGSSMSFPTPDEARKLEASLTVTSTTGNASIGTSGTITAANKASGNEVDESDEVKAMRDLASMSAWTDDDGAGWGTTEADNDHKNPLAMDVVNEAITAQSETTTHANKRENSSRIGSRILTKKSQLARSNLAIFLKKLHEQSVTNQMLLDHLKSLAAPAIDLEFRSLCSNDDDGEGIELLTMLLTWFGDIIVVGTDFELIQAYITRALTIYADIILKKPEIFASKLQAMLHNHQSTCQQFRNLMQSNLCLLKLLSGLPLT